ncbi:MAG: OsmC family protein [Clostridium sp.]|uniref:OsmC family protein n=1 Tax=Clostridium sp. TaxID=1506 RepID=UPI002FCAC52B
MKCIAKYSGKLGVSGVSGEHDVLMDMPTPFGEDRGMTPGDMLLNSIAGCKIISFVSLAKKFNIEFSDIEVEITGEVDKTGFVGDTHIPKKEIVSMNVIYRIATGHTKEEIEDFLLKVDDLCVVGNALSDNIKKTSEVIIKA